MTDQDLIALLKEKGPEGLSESDLALLKERLPQSSVLREALADYVQLEELLVSSLKPVSISPDEIQRRAGREAQPRGAASGPWITMLVAGSGILALFLIAVAIFAALWRPHAGPVVVKPPEVAPPEQPEKKPQPPVDPAAPMPVDPAPPMPDPKPVDPAPPMPMPKPPAPMPPILQPVAIVLDAAEHKQGNVTRGKERWGLADVEYVASNQPAFAEYEIDLPREGAFELRLRYAAEQARPLSLSIDGKKHAAALATKPTPGLSPAQASWTAEGELALKAGKHTLRLESAAAFPQLVQLALSSADALAQVDPTDPRAVQIDKQPWAAAFEQPAPLPPWTAIAFRNFEFDKKLPSRDDLRAWFSAVPGKQSQITQRNVGNIPCGAISGVVRLNCPWTSDSVLRIAHTDCEQLAFHFFDGSQGASAVWHRNYFGFDDAWFGYSTRREGASSVPATMSVTATDDGRGRRTEQRFGGPLELRYRAGEVLVSRGDVVILRVPLAGPPRDVFVEGQATLRGLELARCVGDPPRESSWEGPAKSVSPASLDWRSQLAGGAGKLEKREDGSIVFRADKPNGLAWIAAPFPPGYHAVELACDEVASGMGLFLGNDKSLETAEILHVGNDDRGQQIVMWTNIFNFHKGGPPPPRRIHGPAWFRLLWGPDLLLGWVSSDGRHWASLPSVRRDLRNVTRFGISFPQQVPSSRVVVREIRLREVAPFAALAKPELVARVPAAEHDLEVISLGLWHQLVAESKPADVDYTAWKRAWLVASLGRGINRFAAFGLLDQLVAEMGERGEPAADRLAVLRAAMLLGDAPDNAERVRRIAERFQQVGEEEFRRGEPRPFSLVRHSLMTSQALTPANYRTVHEPLVRWELLSLLAARRPGDVQQLCRELRFFEQHGFCRLTNWAEYAAASQSNVVAAGPAPADVRPEWRSPLIEELSKETYNVLAEFQAVLDSNSPQDAARMITQADPQIAIGLAPSGQDRQLMVSVPVAFAAAIQQDPRLAAAMKQDYGPLAELRVRQAMAEGNPLAVQLITVRYHGTEAAAEAYRWLGDRALSGGQFSLALSHYSRAKATGSAGLRGQINLRARLAAAMLGLDQGDKVTTNVQFGEVRMTAAEYETMVAEAKKNHGGTEGRPAAGLFSPSPAPPPGLYRAERKSRFEGERGQNPQNIEHRHVRALQIPWVDRQIAATIDGDTAYVSNRFHLSAYDLTNGNRRWQSPPAPRVGKAHDWTLVPMRPVATASRIVCRTLLDSGPVLAAYDRANGSLAWVQPPTAGEHVASDPLVFHDTLYAVTVKRQEQGEYHFRLSSFDLASGQLMTHQPLVRMRDTWWERKVCQLAALDDGFAVTLGGVVLACDLAGQVRWIRREMLLPPDEEPEWVRQAHEPPVLHAGKLFVLQPSVRNVSALDPGTGTLLWQTSLPDVQRTIGIADGKLIVQTAQGLAALNPADGKLVWTRLLDGLMEAQLCGPSGEILVAQSIVPPMPRRLVPSLAWVRPQDGTVVARAPLMDLADPLPMLSTLLAREGKLFALAGKSIEDPTRDLVELVRTGDAPPPAAEPRGRFLPLYVSIDDNLQKDGFQTFPGWEVVAGLPGEKTGRLPEAEGEQDVFGLRFDHRGVLGFRSFVALPEKNPRLRLKLHFPPEHKIKLAAWFEGTRLEEKTFDKEPGWKEITIDAKASAGKRGEVLLLLTVEGKPPTPGAVLWKKLEIGQ